MVLSLHVLTRATQLGAGRQLLALRPATGPFVVGSSGVEYAVLAALAAEGGLPHKADFAPLAPAGRLIAVSGSCSPTTARQIRHALEHGFTGIHADPLRLAGGDGAAYTQALCRQAMAGLEQGKSVIAYTALEPESDRSEALDAIADGRHRVGRALG